MLFKRIADAELGSCAHPTVQRAFCKSIYDTMEARISLLYLQSRIWLCYITGYQLPIINYYIILAQYVLGFIK